MGRETGSGGRRFWALTEERLWRTGFWVCLLGFGGWAVLNMEGTFFGFVPLSGFAISPAVGRESVGGRAEVAGLVVGCW